MLVLPKPWKLGTVRIQVTDGNGDFPSWRHLNDAPDVSTFVTSEGRESPLFYDVQTTAMCGVGVSAWFQRVQLDGRWILEAVLEGVPEGLYRVQGWTMMGERIYRPLIRKVRTGETGRAAGAGSCAWRCCRRDPWVG